MDQIILNITLWAVPVILAITLHEAAHGYVARMFGDPTAYEQGRITLNPLKHIDPVGTILLPGGIVLMNALTGAQFPPFGWAKPVPVNFGRLRHPKQDMLWVAAAGPGINFVQAVVWVLFGSLVLPMVSNPGGLEMLGALCRNGLMANLVLMLINLIPIPPLDGGRILVSLLPIKAAWQLSRVEPYGFFILIALMYSDVLNRPLLWAMDSVARFIFLITGVA
ncbi:MAG TPA: site-2 protease family protein [Rhodocyclaceae bacterium]|nr:site-2 protease family protein [Rhodocyclaceae bacterium]